MIFEQKVVKKFLKFTTLYYFLILKKIKIKIKYIKFLKMFTGFLQKILKIANQSFCAITLRAEVFEMINK